MDGASETAAIEQTGLEDPAIMHYTSGSTGKPKGAAASGTRPSGAS